MTASPLITVILPTCNRREMLERALRSVLNQSEGGFVIDVLDDASVDGTSTLVRRWAAGDSRVRLVTRDHRVGGVKNCELGFSAVNTPYFAYLADDDLWFPEFLRIAVNALEAAPDAAFYACRSVCVTERGVPFALSGPLAQGKKEAVAAAEVLWCDNWPQQAGVLYRTAAYRRVGPISNLLGFDLDLLTKMALVLPAIYDPSVLSFFTENTNSASASRKVSTLLREWGEFRRVLASTDRVVARQRLLDAWAERMRGQVRMLTMHSICRGDSEDAQMGAAWLAANAPFVWTTPIIRGAAALSRLGSTGAHLTSRLFCWRRSLFFAVRRILFLLRYSRCAPELWQRAAI